MPQRAKIKYPEAGHVYLLMGEGYFPSKSERAMWVFNNLYALVHPHTDLDENELLHSDRLLVLSVLSKGAGMGGGGEVSQPAVVVPTTRVTYLSRRLRMVFSLDVSPSMYASNEGGTGLLSEELCSTLGNCLTGMLRPFRVPGTNVVLKPELCVSVIAQTPSVVRRRAKQALAPQQMQVLMQGGTISEYNLAETLTRLEAELVSFENELHAAATETRPTPTRLQQPPDTPLFDAAPGLGSPNPARGRKQSDTAVAGGGGGNDMEPGLVATLQNGIFALELLPDSMFGALVVLTDGVVTLDNASLAFDSVLTLFSRYGFPLNFIQVGQGYRPWASFGYVADTELLHFAAAATAGNLLFSSQCLALPPPFPHSCPPNVTAWLVDSVSNTSEDPLSMNIYHRTLCAHTLVCRRATATPNPTFPRAADGESEDDSPGEADMLGLPLRTQEVLLSESTGVKGIVPLSSSFPWALKEPPPPLGIIRKQYKEYTLATGLPHVLSLRLREGYKIDNVVLGESGGKRTVTAKVLLLWKQHVTVEYCITSTWPPPRHYSKAIDHQAWEKDKDDQRAEGYGSRAACKVHIYVAAPYGFIKVFASLNTSKAMLSNKPSGGGMTANAAMMLHQFLSGQQESDMLLVNLIAFTRDPAMANAPPNTHLSGIFYLPQETVTPPPTPSGPYQGARAGNDSSPMAATPAFQHLDAQFRSYWGMIASLGTASWERWLDTDRVALFMQPDHEPVWDKSYVNKLNLNLQYKTANMRVCEVTRAWCTMVLIDNHTYIGFVHPGSFRPGTHTADRVQGGGEGKDQPPPGFCLLRLCWESPCVLVVRLGFLDTPLWVRQAIKQDLRRAYADLTFPPTKQQLPGAPVTLAPPLGSPSLADGPARPLVSLYRKPVRRMLVRYGKEMMMDVVASGQLQTQRGGSSVDLMSLWGTSPTMPGKGSKPRIHKHTPVSILWSYLRHQRWIWSLPAGSERNSLVPSTYTMVLEAMLKMRLREGFRVLVNENGVSLLVKEIKVVQRYGPSGVDDGWGTTPNQPLDSNSPGDRTSSCVLQFMAFPQTSRSHVVTELWIDPQAGTVTDCTGELAYLNGHECQDIAMRVRQKDQQVVYALAMFDYLYEQARAKTKVTLEVVANYHMLHNSDSGGMSSQWHSGPSMSEGTDLGRRGAGSTRQNIIHEPFYFDMDCLLLAGTRLILALPLLREPSGDRSADSLLARLTLPELDGLRMANSGPIYAHDPRRAQMTAYVQWGCAGALHLINADRADSDFVPAPDHNLGPVGGANRGHGWGLGMVSAQNSVLIEKFREALRGMCDCVVALGEKEMVRLWEAMRQYTVAKWEGRGPPVVALPYMFDCFVRQMDSQCVVLVVVPIYQDPEAADALPSGLMLSRQTSTDTAGSEMGTSEDDMLSGDESGPDEHDDPLAQNVPLAFQQVYVHQCERGDFAVEIDRSMEEVVSGWVPKIVTQAMTVHEPPQDIKGVSPGMCETARMVQHAYAVSMVQSVFAALQAGRSISADDFVVAAGLCTPTHMEVDVTVFLHAVQLEAQFRATEQHGLQQHLEARLEAIMAKTFSRVPLVPHYRYLNPSEPYVSPPPPVAADKPRRKGPTLQTADSSVSLASTSAQSGTLHDHSVCSGPEPMFMRMEYVIRPQQTSRAESATAEQGNDAAETTPQPVEWVAPASEMTISLDGLLDRTGVPQEARTSNLQVALRLNSMTAPPLKLPDESEGRKVDLVSAQANKLLEELCLNIRWLVSDEVVSSMRFQQPTSHATLAQVIQHITASPLPSASRHRVPLKFVEAAAGCELFAERLDTITVGAFRVAKCAPESPPAPPKPDRTRRPQAPAKTQALYYLWQPAEDGSETKRIPFWVVLQVGLNELSVFVHRRQIGGDTPRDDGGGHMEALYGELEVAVAALVKKVNQLLLLKDLHETKMCSSLLVPPSGRDRQLGQMEEEETDYDALIKNGIFQKGEFECEEVFTASIPLHWRLRSQQAVRASWGVLSAFSVANRAGLYVCQESTGGVYYMLVTEVTSQMKGQSADRRTSSSADAATITSDPQTTLPVSQSQDAEGTFVRTAAIQLRPMPLQTVQECVLVQVFGVDAPGPDITNHLLNLLKSKLHAVTLSIISELLERNVTIRLTQPDIDFILPPNEKPTRQVQIKLPAAVADYYALLVYVRQTLLLYLNTLNGPEPHSQSDWDDTLSARLPTGFLSDHHGSAQGPNSPGLGSGVTSPLRFGEGQHGTVFTPQTCAGPSTDAIPVDVWDFTFLYNCLPKPGMRMANYAIGQGIACVQMLLGRDGIEQLSSVPRAATSSGLFVDAGMDLGTLQPEDYTDASIANDTQSGSYYLRLKMWTHGSIDCDALVKKLTGSVNQALCDYAVEDICRSYPLLAEPTGDQGSVCVHGAYSGPLLACVAKGRTLENPAMTVQETAIVIPRWATNPTLSELGRIVQRFLPAASSAVFSSCGTTNRFVPYVPSPDGKPSGTQSPPTPSSTPTYMILASNITWDTSLLPAPAPAQTLHATSLMIPIHRDGSRSPIMSRQPSVVPGLSDSHMSMDRTPSTDDAVSIDSLTLTTYNYLDQERYMLYPPVTERTLLQDAMHSPDTTQSGPLPEFGHNTHTQTPHRNSLPATPSALLRPAAVGRHGSLLTEEEGLSGNSTATTTPEPGVEGRDMAIRSLHNYLQTHARTPRHFIAAWIVGRDMVSLHLYNCAPALRQQLETYTTQVLSWQCNRAHLLISVLHQKMGLFYHLTPVLPKHTPAPHNYILPDLGATSAGAAGEQGPPSQTTGLSTPATPQSTPLLPGPSSNNTLSGTPTTAGGPQGEAGPVAVSQPPKVRLTMDNIGLLIYSPTPPRRGVSIQAPAYAAMHMGNAHAQSASSGGPSFPLAIAVSKQENVGPPPAGGRRVTTGHLPTLFGSPAMPLRRGGRTSNSTISSNRVGGRPGSGSSISGGSNLGRKESAAVAFATMLRYNPPLEPIPRDSPDPVLRHGAQFLRMAARLREMGEKIAEINDICFGWQAARLEPPKTITTPYPEDMPKPSLPLPPGKSVAQVLPYFRFFHFCCAPLLLVDNTPQDGSEDVPLLPLGPLKDFMQQYIEYLGGALGLQVVEYSRRIARDPSDMKTPEGIDSAYNSTSDLVAASVTQFTHDTDTFLVKAFEGGVYVVKLSLNERNVCVDVYAMSSARLYANIVPAWLETSQSATRVPRPTHREERMFAVEMASLKHRLHIKSFVYDFHLRHFTACLGTPVPPPPQTENRDCPLLDTLGEYKRTSGAPPLYARNRLYGGVLAVDCTNPNLPSDTLPTVPKATFIRYMLGTAHRHGFTAYPSTTHPQLVFLQSIAPDFLPQKENSALVRRLSVNSGSETDSMTYTLVAYVNPYDLRDDEEEEPVEGARQVGADTTQPTKPSPQPQDQNLFDDAREGESDAHGSERPRETASSLVIADFVQRHQRMSLPTGGISVGTLPDAGAHVGAWSYVPSPLMSPAVHSHFPDMQLTPTDGPLAYGSSTHFFRLQYYVVATHSNPQPIMTHAELARERSMHLLGDLPRTYAEQRLRQLIEKVDVACRRDLLWEYLRTGGPGYGNAQLSCREFLWLTALAHSVPIESRDPKLKQLLDLPTDWHALVAEVALAWGSNVRQFRLECDADGPPEEHAVLFSRSHSDQLLLHVQMPATTTPPSDFQGPANPPKVTILHKEAPSEETEDVGEAEAQLVADFVNRACAYVWAHL